MGWFWGSNSNKSSNVTDNLEPGLREFLEKEAPRKYTPSQTSSSAAQPDTYRSQLGLERPEQPSPPTAASSTSTPPVPTESLYQDGRYAHLWKGYRPLDSIEDASKTDQDRLLDVLEGFKERRAQIGRAALENCANEQIAVSECFKNGGWTARMTMCKAQNRELSRCYMTQAKFLKALGYLRLQERTPEEEERIQMHADMLYHRMLEQEKAMKEAKEKGLPIPEFDPIVPRPQELDRLAVREEKPEATTPTSSVGLESNLPTPNMPGRRKLTLNDLNEDTRKKLLKRLENLSPEERLLEEQVIAGELEHGEDAIRNLSQVYEVERKNRLARKEAGKETVADKIRTSLGW